MKIIRVAATVAAALSITALKLLYSSPAAATAADQIGSSAKIQKIAVTGDTAAVTWSATVQGKSAVVTSQMRRIDGRWKLVDTARK